MLKRNDHVLDYVDAHLHGVLSAEEAAIVDHHCDECPICRVALEEARKRAEAFTSLPAVETSGELIERTERRLRQAFERSRRATLLGWLERRSTGQRLTLAASAVAVLIAALHVYFLKLSPSPYDLRVLGQEKLLAGAETSLRVLLFNHGSNTLLAGVPVSIELTKPGTTQLVRLAQFKTDERGTGRPRFRLPEWDDGDYQLRVAARVGHAQETITRSVTLRRSWQVMVSPDKPVYRPGDVIRVRSLALRRPDLKPVAGSPVAFSVSDPKGNMIFRRRDVTSRYGIASAECPLAAEIMHGKYKVECQVGDTTSSATVEVKNYVLPKFKVRIDVDRPYYQPGEMIRGTVQSDYFFGKPVADATVRLELRSAVGATPATETVSQRTNSVGKTEFAFRIPATIASSGQEDVDARIALKATVVDTGGQEQSSEVLRLVTNRPLRVEVIPETGQLVAGVRNSVYILTTYADGRPARTHVSVTGFARPIVTSDLGVALLRIMPDDRGVTWTVRAVDEQGISARKEVTLLTGQAVDDFLVRTDKAVYDGGQTIHLTIRGSGGEPVFIDLIKDGQTVLADSISITDGRGEHDLDLPPDLFGTIELCTYRYRLEGTPLRKNRVLYVRQAKTLDVQARLDQKEYRPGGLAKIELQLADKTGNPTPGAISLAAVDEAVYSILNGTTGSEPAFFTLNDQLLKPVLSVYPWSPKLTQGAGDGERMRLEKAIFSRTAQRSRDNRDVLMKELLPYLDHQSRVFEVLDRPDWELLAKDRLPEDVKSLLRNEQGLHTISASTYPARTVEVERQRRDGIAFVKGLWSVFMIVGGTVLFCYFLAVAFGRSYAEAIGVVVILLLLMAMMMPAVQSAREAARRTQARNDLMQIELALDNFRDSTGRLPGELADEKEKDSASESPRVRQWFPETLLWRPEIITDDQGRANVSVDLADSITTWRLTASAVSATGELGASASSIRVFQPFFVDLNLPVALTRGDEVSVPVIVHNFLDKPQSVTIALDDAPWFDRLDESTKKLDLSATEVGSVHFRLRARKVGDQQLQVTAKGSGIADAIRRTIAVLPDGRRVENVVSGTLGQPASIELAVPADAIEGSVKTIVKIYPSSFSQLVEGLDSIFERPYGCFEQTSSTTYPNVLALDYLKRTKSTVPAVEAKAKHFIHLGYQRLLSFEVNGGGFDWFGHPPANRILTAYGLMEFADMARVHDVDPDLIQRTRKWLLAQRRNDGSWAPEGHGLESDPARGSDSATLSATAYIAWAVFGTEGSAADAEPSVNYLLRRPANSIADPYTLALVANALLAIIPQEPAIQPYLERLEALKHASGDGRLIWWQQPPGSRTAFYGAGPGGSVETTALSTLALIAAGRSSETVRAGLAWLVAQKDGSGTWRSTQATVLALKALIAASGQPLGGTKARRIQALLDGKPLPEIVIPADQADVMKQIDLSDRTIVGRHMLTLSDVTETASGFQVVAWYHAPESAKDTKGQSLSIGVTYDRQELTVGAVLSAVATLTNAAAEASPMVIAELPIPAGFVIEPDDFAALVKAGTIAKFQISPRGAIVYLRAIEPRGIVTLRYRLRPTMPVMASIPAAVAYEYYNSDKKTMSRANRVVVRANGAK